MEGVRRGRLSSMTPEEEDSSIRVSENFLTQVSGFFHKYAFEQDKKATDIVEVLYNDRMRVFVLVDVRGITTWRPEAIDESIKRSLTYPKYVYRKFVSLVFARRYNVYFALSKDFCLEVLNREFDSICTIAAEMRNTTFMVFDHARDELITGGMEGLKIWKYGPSSKKVYGQIKPMSNYELTLKVDLSGQADVSSVKIAQVDSRMGYLYCCSDTDIICFSLLESGRQLCKFTGAHKGGICGCVYSPATQLLVTAAADAEIKLWNFSHGYTGMLTGHSRPITALRVMPDDTHIILTAAMDGSIRMWSLAVMECLYQVQVSSQEGIRWMGFGDPGQIFVASQRNVNVYTMSYLPEFWAHQRADSLRLQLISAEGKTTRLMSVCSDSSVRFFSRKSGEPLSTLLSPPCISPFNKLRDFAHSRALGFSYLLVDSRKLWVYLSRTNPASLVAEWNLAEVQAEVNRRGRRPRALNATLLKELSGRRAVSQPIAKESRVVDVTSVACLHSPVVMWTDDGDCCPPVLDFLLLGLEDGRVLFLDPVEKSQRYLELTVGKETVVGMREDRYHNCLITTSLAQEAIFIAVWSLPQLTLEHEIAAPRDLTGFSRLQSTLITGHRSGHVIVHGLDICEEGMGRPSIPESFKRRKPEHSFPIVAVDSCPCRDSFLSVSEDGAVKIWNAEQIMLSEVTLDESVSCAAFLNSAGDIILAMKSHLFILTQSKYSSIDDDTASISTVPESEIIEDPAIKYEGIVADPDPVNLQTYLSPFKAELSTKFTDHVHEEEKNEEVEETESEEESVFSSADEALLSPFESVLDGSITETDENYLHRWTRIVHNHPRSELAYEYEMPSLGQSPVSTPVPSVTPTSTPEPKEAESEEEEVEVEDVKQPEVRHVEEKKMPPLVKPAPPKSAPSPFSPPKLRTRVSERLEAARIDPSDIPAPRQRPPPPSPPARTPLVPTKTAPALETRPRPRPPRRRSPDRKKRPTKQRGGKSETKTLRSRGSISEKSGPAPTLSKVDIGEAQLSKVGSGQEKIRSIRKAPPVLAQLMEDLSDDEEDEEFFEEVEEEVKQAEEGQRVKRFSANRRRGRTPFVSTPSRTPDSTRLSVPDSGVAISPEDLDSLYEHPYNLHRSAKDSMDSRPITVTPEDSGAWGLESDVGTDPSIRLVAPKVGISKRIPEPPRTAELGRPAYDIKADEAMLEELQWALHLPRQAFPLTDDEADPETLQAEQEQFQKLNQFYEKLLHRYQSSRPNTPLERLFHNDGVNALAPDQQIERHILLRLRRQLRQHSAAEKRRTAFVEQEERRRALTGHRYCAYEPPQSQMSKCAREERLAPAQRPFTSIPEKERPSSTVRPATVAVEKDRRERKATPYRFTRGSEVQGENVYDLKARNDFKLHLRAKYSAPSIPSKCRRYALISNRSHDADTPAPSLAEERLIRDRFPQFTEQWVGENALLEPKPWMLALRHSSES